MGYFTPLTGVGGGALIGMCDMPDVTKTKNLILTRSKI